MEPIIIENYKDKVAYITSKYAPRPFFDYITNPSTENLNNVPNEWKTITFYHEVGLIPNAIMYYSILELYKQRSQSNDYNIWEKYPSTPIPPTTPSSTNRMIINGVFNELFEMYAPKDVLDKLHHNREVSKNNPVDTSQYKELPDDYAYLEKFTNIGLGYPVFLQFILKDIINPLSK